VVFYAAGLIVVGLLWWLLWLDATAHCHLVHPNLDRRVIANNACIALFPPVVIVASIAVSFASPLLAELSWLLIALVRPAVGRLVGDSPAGPSTPLPPPTGREVATAARTSPNRCARRRRRR
jgi:hypothetical protein